MTTLIEHAADCLLASCVERPSPEIGGYLRDAVDRLLRERNGVIETDGETYVCQDTLRAVLVDVAQTAAQRFLADLRLPRGHERDTIATELGRISALADATLERMFSESCLH
jgi:hypothetical protein